MRRRDWETVDQPPAPRRNMERVAQLSDPTLPKPEFDQLLLTASQQEALDAFELLDVWGHLARDQQVHNLMRQAFILDESKVEAEP